MSPGKKNHDEIRRVQHKVNDFTEHTGVFINPILADGDDGPATHARIRAAKYYLGYQREKIGPGWGDNFLERLEHPKTVNPKWKQSEESIARGHRRRVRRREEIKKNRAKASRTSGVATYDSVPVAAWLVPYLDYARNHGWRGRLVSGWRDPHYSQTLCFRICGQPSCPGRCAGLASNHVGSDKPKGAVDVSDYARFGTIMRQCPLSPRIFCALGSSDPVHFSASGR